MKLLKSLNGAIDDGADKTREYAEKEYEHLKLRVFYHLANIAVQSANKLLLILCVSLFCFFGLIALAFYLGALTGSIALGFLLTSVVFILLAVVAYLLRDKIEKYIVNSLSANYFKL